MSEAIQLIRNNNGYSATLPPIQISQISRKLFDTHLIIKLNSNDVEHNKIIKLYQELYQKASDQEIKTSRRTTSIRLGLHIGTQIPPRQIINSMYYNHLNKSFILKIKINNGLANKLNIGDRITPIVQISLISSLMFQRLYIETEYTQ